MTDSLPWKITEKSPTAKEDAGPFMTRQTWNVERPKVLVVCCSDGRLQEPVDEFLEETLGIQWYDRFYAPGGPGALAPSGSEFLRASQYQDDAAFLLRAHGVEDLILIFHGAAADGPEEATCAHYRRVMPSASPEDIRQQQAQDARDVVRSMRGLGLPMRVHAFRAEVTATRQVRFVPLEWQD